MRPARVITESTMRFKYIEVSIMLVCSLVYSFPENRYPLDSPKALKAMTMASRLLCVPPSELNENTM